MFSVVKSAAVVGINAVTVWVEVNISRGLPYFHLVGLPDSTIRESRERVRIALRNAGFSFPVARLTVNLAPGNLPKAGSAYDLPIALAILAAQGELSTTTLSRWIVMGELALDGSVRSAPGVLCTALDLMHAEADEAILMIPEANAHEVHLLPGLKAAAVHSLGHAVHVLRNGIVHRSGATDSPNTASATAVPVDPVIGQEAAKRALQISLAGAHNALLIGPPGSGKTLLGDRLSAMRPSLNKKEMWDVNRVYSAVGLLSTAGQLHRLPPIRAPHHTITTRAMIGGGHPPTPGEISLAHRGILLLDEITLFRRSTLEALRTPSERGHITVTRGGVTTTMPSRFSLIGTTNPCPCGWLGDEERLCHCSAADIDRYHKRLAGPLLDRMDMVVAVSRPEKPMMEALGDERSTAVATETTLAATVAQIAQARAAQHQRNADNELNGMHENTLAADMAMLDTECRALLARAAQRYALTGRRLHRTIRVARTIADLDASPRVMVAHIAEALAYRVELPWLDGAVR